MGIMGFAGSGKTYTAAEIAIGLTKYMQAKGLPGADKPIFFLDTETGSDWVKPKIEGEGIKLFTAKTKAFLDLTTAMKEAPGNAAVLIIDSITHFWVEFCDTYQERKERKRGLEFQDWAYLKKEWRRKFTEPFVNSPLHVVLCGRAGFEYEHYVDDAGKKQIEKSGVKMKAEGELGFEPSILVMMDREQDVEARKLKHIATVMKDRRSDAKTLDGKRIENPKFKDFLPHIEFLNLGGHQLGVDSTRSSASMIEPDTFDRRKIDRETVLDLIDNLLTMHLGSTQEDKRKRIEACDAAFGTSSKTFIEKQVSLQDLKIGYDRLHLQFKGQPGPYGTMGEQAPDVVDEIPALAEKPRIRVDTNGNVKETA